MEEKIINSPLFLKLKTVIENSPWHDHEAVYDHLIKTHKIAEEQINGGFITNEEARKLFLDFTNESIDGVKRKDLMLITALIHDIGKILYYKENDKEQPLRHENLEGITRMPGHEYYGSTIVSELLKDTGLTKENIEKIANVVRLHDTFNDGHFNNSLSEEEIVDDIKARAEGFYKEVLFNIYCDVFTAKPSEYLVKRIAEIFNQSSLYTPREYFIK